MTMVAGIDVGKANLDVSVSGGPVLRFDNTATGITKLRKHLQEHDTTLAVCEPTGGYERLLTSRLRETAIAVHVVHPGRVRAFAKACGYEAKTDPLDAQVLSRYGEVFPEADTWEPETDPQREELRDLLRRRRQFVDQRVQELGRLDKGISAAIAKSTRRHIAGWRRRSLGWRRNTRPSPTRQCHARRPRRPVPHRARHRAANRGNPGGSPSRTGPLG